MWRIPRNLILSSTCFKIPNALTICFLFIFFTRKKIKCLAIGEIFKPVHIPLFYMEKFGSIYVNGTRVRRLLLPWGLGEHASCFTNYCVCVTDLLSDDSHCLLPLILVAVRCLLKTALTVVGVMQHLRFYCGICSLFNCLPTIYSWSMSNYTIPASVGTISDSTLVVGNKKRTDVTQSVKLFLKSNPLYIKRHSFYELFNILTCCELFSLRWILLGTVDVRCYFMYKYDLR